MNLMALLMLAAVVGMSARIAQKAGFSGWWGLVQVVPLAGVIMMWVLAFVDWRSLPPPQRPDEDLRLPPPD